MELTRVFVAMEKIEGIDMRDFFYKLQTGRLLNDGKICELVNMKISDLIYEVNNYLGFYSGSITNISITELEEKNYLNNSSRKTAKQISHFYNNNVWDLNQGGK